MIEQGKTNSGSLIGVLLVIGAIALYVFVGKGIAAENVTLETELETKGAQLESFANEEQRLEEAKEELNLTSSVEQFTSLAAIPAAVDQDEVIRSVVEIAGDYDIELNSISFARSGASVDGIATLRVNASFEGNYTDLIDFLEGLEQHERLFKVNNINVQINTLNFSGLERANFSLTIDTFYQE